VRVGAVLGCPVPPLRLDTVAVAVAPVAADVRTIE
jgi:hypothetical protein